MFPRVVVTMPIALYLVGTVTTPQLPERGSMTVQIESASPGYRMFSVGPEPLEAENIYYRLLDELETRLPSEDLPERMADAVTELVAEARDEMACEFEMRLERVGDEVRAISAPGTVSKERPEAST
jgi:hypothetical protein